jgi:hypothetical protein
MIELKNGSYIGDVERAKDKISLIFIILFF